MPSNIHLRIHDCLSEPPSDLLEEYDVIHLQCFNSVVPENDPVPVVRNLLKMLSQCWRLSHTRWILWLTGIFRARRLYILGRIRLPLLENHDYRLSE